MKLQYEILYRLRGDRAENLPWHREEPPALLQEAVAERPARGRALDLGAGAGHYACWLAAQGFEVTALDFVERAVQMTRERAADLGLDVRVAQADVLRWPEDAQYDVVFDSGCLHGLTGTSRRGYRDRVLRWLAPDGDYILVHFEKRHRLDWRPMGPRRISRRRIEGLFAPRLELHAHTAERVAAPQPVGTIRLGSYWFRRSDS